MFGSRRREREFLEALDQHDAHVTERDRVTQARLLRTIINGETVTIADTEKIRQILGPSALS